MTFTIDLYSFLTGMLLGLVIALGAGCFAAVVAYVPPKVFR